MKVFNEEINFIVIFILALNVAAKKIATNSCGSEVYSIYHTQLNVPCYDDQDIDDLPIMDLKKIKNDSIFFIEASCKGGLNIRQACSVEAAAKVNPSRQVYVFFAGVVSHQCVRVDPLASLLSYENVRLYRIHPEDFAHDSGLDYILRSAIVNQNPYPVLYALELLKFIALYKFGGVYMDMDMLATRPFDDLPYGENWVPIYDHARGTLSAGIMSISNNAIGRKLAESIISLLKEPRAQDMTSVNVIKASVEKICGVVPFEETTQGLSFTCHGLMLYSNMFFIPIPCESSEEYFQQDLAVVANLTRSFTQLLCNGLTYLKPIPRISTNTTLMSQYCPKVYSYFERMGFKEQSQIIEEIIDIQLDSNNDNIINNSTSKGRLEKTNEGNASISIIDGSKKMLRKWFYDILKKDYNNNSSTCSEIKIES